MTRREHFELPEALWACERRARRLEQISIVFLLGSVVLLYLVKGQSQALKVAWIEDSISLVAPLAFLLSDRYRKRPPDEQHPYGYHSAPALAFLAASIALMGIGLFLLVDSGLSLIAAEHPSIGSVIVLGHQLWLGWLMLAVLAYKGSFAVLLGHLKHQPAVELHNKVLFADAQTNKADWASAGATAVGVIAIGFGLWWADAAAAIVISIFVIRDGASILRLALGDLIDRAPRTVDGKRPDPLVLEATRLLEASPFVARAHLRMREHGQILFADATLEPSPGHGIPVGEFTRLHDELIGLHWRIHDVVLGPHPTRTVT